jgi:probable F420-dependent oxidoreductase
MKLGLVLPVSGSEASPEAIAAVAEGAERIGLDSVWTFERLMRPTTPAAGIEGWTAELPDSYGWVYDPLDTLAYLAGRTSTITLGTSVLDSVLHSPIVLARRLATVDQLSGGRLVAGLGVGWMVAEYEAAGVPTAGRGARFGEHVRAMRAVWGPDPVEHDGPLYRIAPSQAGPKPAREGGPALLAGAAAPAAIERAARLGMGLNHIMMTWDMLSSAVSAFREASEKSGQDPATLPVVVRVNGAVERAPVDGEREPLTGGVDQVLEDLDRARTAGVEHVFWTMEGPVEEQLAVMKELLAGRTG